MSYLSFKDHSRLLAFVSFVASDSWDELEHMSWFESHDQRNNVLEVPEGVLDDIDKNDLIHFGATSAVKPGGMEPIPLRKLHARAKLKRHDQRVTPSTLLVLPLSPHGLFNQAQIAELISELSLLTDYTVSLWPAKFTDGQKEALTLLRLDAKSRVLRDRKLDFTGRPYILGGDAEGINFIPLGHRHPLAGTYDFFFPILG